MIADAEGNVVGSGTYTYAGREACGDPALWSKLARKLVAELSTSISNRTRIKDAPPPCTGAP